MGYSRKRSNSIFDVLEMGPICAGDDELGILITVNGAYLNAWVGSEENGWNNTDCQALSSDNGLYSITGSKMIDRAKEYLDEIIKGDDEESDDDE